MLKHTLGTTEFELSIDLTVINIKAITVVGKKHTWGVPSVFCDELVMFHGPVLEGWAPPRSSCGRCSPATAADRGSSHGTPERKDGIKKYWECVLVFEIALVFNSHLFLLIW